MPGKRGDSRLARLRTLITRAQQRCGVRAGEVRVAHRWLLAIAHTLEPADGAAAGAPVTGGRVRQQVEAQLVQSETVMASGHLASWLRPALTHLVTILRRVGDGLYHCYDVPDLPRTDNGLEQFYRRVKACERRITGHRRSDRFVMRLGEFAVYAVAAGDLLEGAVLGRMARVSAPAWQDERAALRATGARQTTMWRFRRRRAAFLANLEARWAALTGSP
jgi:hypothetical protein